MDELLDDIEVPLMRSGGNWLTWPFKVISVDELLTLKEERRAKREAGESVIPPGTGGICAAALN